MGNACSLFKKHKKIQMHVVHIFIAQENKDTNSEKAGRPTKNWPPPTLFIATLYFVHPRIVQTIFGNA